MKQFLSILLFALFIPSSAYHSGDAPIASFDAMVVLSIAELDDETLARLGKQLGKEKNVSIEYSCTWSGLVVLKYSEIGVGEKADVMTLVRRQLSAAGLDRGVEFVHVHVEGRGVGKC